VDDEILEEVFSHVPGKCGEGGTYENHPSVPGGRQEPIEKKEHNEDYCHVEQGKYEDNRCLPEKGRKDPDYFCLNHEAKDKAEKEYRLDQREEQGKQKLLALSPDETLRYLAENNLEGRSYNPEETDREEKQEEQPEGSREPFGKGNQIEFLKDFFDDCCIVGVGHNIFQILFEMEAGIAQIDQIAEDENGKQGERYEGEEYVKGDGRDKNIAVVLLVLCKEGFGDPKDGSGLPFLCHNRIVLV
jgi:hypothetical protein